MVPSLLNIVRDYVIGNICNVESLRGLPETMGEWLFKAFLMDVTAESKLDGATPDRRRRRQRLVHGLTVFCDAYGGLMLSSLNLSRRLVAINEFTECLIPLMTNVTSLNLSHCEVGSDHELVQHFVHMRCVRRLSMRDCAVTDDFLRKMTIPSRVLKKGLVTLREFDLSCNSKITDKSLSHLSCLKELNILSLSGTAVTTTAAKVFGLKTGLTLVESRFDEMTSLSASSAEDGWAEGLLQRLCIDQTTFSNDQEQARWRNQRTLNPDVTPFFYSHRKARQRLAEELKLYSEPREHPVIGLIRYPKCNLDVHVSVLHRQPARERRQSNNVMVDDETLRGYLVVGGESKSKSTAEF